MPVRDSLSSLTPLTTLTPLTPNKYETKRFSPTVLPRQDSGGSRAVTPPMDWQLSAAHRRAAQAQPQFQVSERPHHPSGQAHHGLSWRPLKRGAKRLPEPLPNWMPEAHDNWMPDPHDNWMPNPVVNWMPDSVVIWIPDSVVICFPDSVSTSFPHSDTNRKESRNEPKRAIAQL